MQTMQKLRSSRRPRSRGKLYLDEQNQPPAQVLASIPQHTRPCSNPRNVGGGTRFYALTGREVACHRPYR
eukprot:442935-Pyramimonas_sp.AAC.1